MGGASKSSQQTSSQGSSAGSTFVDPNQVPFLQNLFQGTQGVLQGQGGIGGVATGLGNQLGQSGNMLLGQLQNIGGGQLGPGVGGAISNLLGLQQNPLAQQLQGTLTGGGPGTDVLGSIAGGSGGALDAQLQTLLGESPALQGQISALDAAIQQNLQSTVGTIAGQATLAGATGGARQALASGLAGQEAQQQFAQGAGQLIGQDFAGRQALAPLAVQQQIAGQQQQLQAATQLQQGGQFNTQALSALLGLDVAAAGQAGQLGLGAQGIQAGAAQAGIGALPDLFNLGLSPFAAEFAPFLNAAQIFGAPTVLGQNVSSSSSAGFSDSSGFQILSFSEA